MKSVTAFVSFKVENFFLEFLTHILYTWSQEFHAGQGLFKGSSQQELFRKKVFLQST